MSSKSAVWYWKIIWEVWITVTVMTEWSHIEVHGGVHLEPEVLRSSRWDQSEMGHHFHGHGLTHGCAAFGWFPDGFNELKIFTFLLFGVVHLFQLISQQLKSPTTQLWAWDLVQKFTEFFVIPIPYVGVSGNSVDTNELLSLIYIVDWVAFDETKKWKEFKWDGLQHAVISRGWFGLILLTEISIGFSITILCWRSSFFSIVNWSASRLFRSQRFFL